MFRSETVLYACLEEDRGVDWYQLLELSSCGAVESVCIMSVDTAVQLIGRLLLTSVRLTLLLRPIAPTLSPSAPDSRVPLQRTGHRPLLARRAHIPEYMSFDPRSQDGCRNADASERRRLYVGEGKTSECED